MNRPIDVEGMIEFVPDVDQPCKEEPDKAVKIRKIQRRELRTRRISDTGAVK